MARQRLFRFETVSSTNDKTREIIQNEKPSESLIVWADEQTKGRGHGTSSWESEKGKNLTFSLLLFPGFVEITRQFIISKAISLGIRDFISLYAKDSTVKWPNDVLVGNRKIAGILIENSILNNRIEHCIAGIGININQESFSEHLPDAVSLKMLTGYELDLEEAFQVVSDCIEKRILQIQKGDSHMIDREYLENLYKLNEMGEFQFKEKPFRGKIIGIDKQGRLLIETGPEEVKVFNFKEVSFS
jgi:BirA family transcriptional regulator, biotin operon repressor / biotin---[acetyl-CoA-carboxylase] ligase